MPADTVPAWFALASLAVSPVITVIGTSTVAKATANRDQQRWLREQRTAAYKVLLEQANRVYVERLDSERERVAAGRPPAKKTEDVVLPADLAAAVDAVELLGPKTVGDALETFIKASVWAEVELAATSVDLERLDLARDTSQKRLVARMREALESHT